MCMWASVREPASAASSWPLVTHSPCTKPPSPLPPAGKLLPPLYLGCVTTLSPPPRVVLGWWLHRYLRGKKTEARGAGRTFRWPVRQPTAMASLPGPPPRGWGVRQDGSERSRGVVILALESGSSGSDPSFAPPPSHLQLPHLQREDINEDGISYSSNPMPRAQ